MDYHGIYMQGPFVMETGSIPVFNASDERRIKYDPSNEKMYFASSTAWIELSEQYGEIPQNTIMLFLSDIAITGFTLLTDNGIEDKVVYITKGSAAGGEAGGTDKSGGTWTQPVHSHLLNTHFHGFAAHQHNFSSTTNTVTSTAQNEIGSSDAAWTDHGHTFSGITTSAGGNTGLNIGGITGDSVSPDWRPKGRNFTRQQRT